MKKNCTRKRRSCAFYSSRLTPHFFINNLNVIYSLAQVQDYAAIGDMVMALTDYFRYAMRPISQMVLLADEIQHVNNYLAIQRMRYKNRFAVEIDCPPEHAACSVPLFVMQTFVGNSLKYAFLGDNRVLIHIAVSADARLETLQIAIDDNGPGFPEAILSRQLGAARFQRPYRPGQPAKPPQASLCGQGGAFAFQPPRGRRARWHHKPRIS